MSIQLPKKEANPVLKQIEDDVFFAFKRAQAELVVGESAARRVEYHVSDYVKSCMRQVAYSKSGDGGVPSMNGDQMGTFYTGQLVHAHSDLQGVAHELPMCYNIVTDKAIPYDEKKKKFDIPEGTDMIDLIFGKLDDLLKRQDGTFVIADKKTHSFDSYKISEPGEQYVDQLNQYRLMLLRAKGIDAQYGCLIYTDDSDKFKKTLTFAFELRPIEVTQADLIQKRKELVEWKKTGKLPKRVRYWACERYCAHATRCFMEDD